MESNEQVEAREALDAVERERAETARHYRVPPRVRRVARAGGRAAGASAIALSNTLDGWRGSLALVGGALVALAIMGAQVARFKRLNGMWVSGLIAGRTRAVTAVAFLAEALGIVARRRRGTCGPALAGAGDLAGHRCGLRVAQPGLVDDATSRSSVRERRRRARPAHPSTGAAAADDDRLQRGRDRVRDAARAPRPQRLGALQAPHRARRRGLRPDPQGQPRRAAHDLGDGDPARDAGRCSATSPRCAR